MTLQEIIDAARYLVNEPLSTSRSFPDNTSSFWTDSVLTVYHNLVAQDVQAEIIQTDEDYFITQANLNIVAGTAQYDLPANLVKVKRVEDNRDTTNPIEIYPVTINNRYPPYPRTNETATVQGAYYIRGNQIVFTDTPTFNSTASYRVHYVKRVTDITAGSESSELPRETDRVVVWGMVRMMQHQQQADPSIASAEYQNLLTKAKSQAEDRQIQRPRRVVRTDFKGDL